MSGAPQTADAASAAAAVPQRILVVDDTPLNVKMLADILTFKGYRTVETESAEEGLKVAEEQRPDLILMDFHLPGMDGIEALAMLRANPATASIPVIAVTASAMTEDRARIMKAGFEGLQTKPISVLEFIAAVETALARKREGGSPA